MLVEVTFKLVSTTSFALTTMLFASVKPSLAPSSPTSSNPSFVISNSVEEVISPVITTFVTPSTAIAAFNWAKVAFAFRVAVAPPSDNVYPSFGPSGLAAHPMQAITKTENRHNCIFLFIFC